MEPNIIKNTDRPLGIQSEAPIDGSIETSESSPKNTKKSRKEDAMALAELLYDIYKEK